MAQRYLNRKNNMRKVFLLLLVLFCKKSAGFFGVLNSKAGLVVKKSGESSFLDKLKEGSGGNKTKTFRLNDRNDKSAVSSGILSSFGEEENTDECPHKKVICKYNEDKGKTVCHENCQTYRTSPEAYSKKYLAKAKTCTPQCYRGRCVKLCNQKQFLKEICRS